jgi:hypothetical protein
MAAFWRSSAAIVGHIDDLLAAREGFRAVVGSIRCRSNKLLQ